MKKFTMAFALILLCLTAGCAGWVYDALYYVTLGGGSSLIPGLGDFLTGMGLGG